MASFSKIASFAIVCSAVALLNGAEVGAAPYVPTATVTATAVAGSDAAAIPEAVRYRGYGGRGYGYGGYRRNRGGGIALGIGAAILGAVILSQVARSNSRRRYYRYY